MTAPPLTPGAYLKARRTAQLLSVADVAARLGTEPAIPQHDRAAWLDRIEADIAPAGPDTVDALRRVVRFDPAVLQLLARIAAGENLTPPAICRVCACSWADPCLTLSDRRLPDTCAWAEPDLCSVCAGLAPVAFARAAPPPIGAAA